MDKQAYVPVPEGRTSAIPNKLTSDDIFLSTAPFFHIMGIFAGILSVFKGTPFVYPPPHSPMTTGWLVDVIQITNPTVAVIVPTLVEEISHSSSAMETLSTLRTVYIGGAPLAPEIGQTLNQKTNLVSVMGASELGLVPSLVPEDKEDWEYFEWNPNYGVHMEPAGENLFEMVIPRGETRDIHGIFHTFPDLDKYRTKDLFSPHPIRPNLWRFEGRLGDIIILSNGEKLNPVPMEKIIEGNPLVSRAVVIGHGRFQAALLIEPPWESWSQDKSVKGLVARIWPAVEQANQAVSPSGQIGRMRIGVASPEKPFNTTPKGSTQRRKVLESYQEEIEAIYQHDAYWGSLLKTG